MIAKNNELDQQKEILDVASSNKELDNNEQGTRAIDIAKNMRDRLGAQIATGNRVNTDSPSPTPTPTPGNNRLIKAEVSR